MVQISTLLFTLTAIASSLVAAAPSNANTWPDSRVKAPFGFKAFPTFPNSSDVCETEVIFNRDSNDDSWQYDVFAVYPNGKTWYLKSEVPSNGTKVLAYVETHPYPGSSTGQYMTKNNTVLTPILVNLCDVGRDDPNFPAELKGQKTTTLRVQATPTNVAHPDKTVWYSDDFQVQLDKITPQRGQIQNLSANFNAYQEGDANHKHITVKWQVPKDTSDIQGYFILYGSSQYDSYVLNYYIDDPSKTSADLDVGYYVTYHDVAFVVLNKAGGLTAWHVVPQVPLQTPVMPTK